MNEKRFVRLLWVAKALLLAALVSVGFEVVTSRLRLSQVLDPVVASGVPSAPDKRSARPETRAPSDYAAIARSNLFTEPGADKPPLDPPPVKALDALPAADELGLRLIGAIAGGPAVSRANIQNAKTNTTGVYRIGDTVASATVQAIGPDTVILRYQGESLVLRLQTGAAEDRGQRAEGREPKTEEAGTKTVGQNPLAAGVDPGSPELAAAGSMTEIFRKATIEPYIKNKRTEGLRITGLDKIPMAGVFGFKDGDIVQSVNGQQLTSKQKAFQVLMKAKTQAKIDLQLLRDGKSKNLSFDL